MGAQSLLWLAVCGITCIVGLIEVVGLVEVVEMAGRTVVRRGIRRIL